MVSTPSGFRSIAQAFSYPNYRYYATGNGVHFTGQWMQRIAVGWLTWELTESGGWLGLMAMADLFPSIIFGPIAGAIADRYDRMRLLKFVQSVAMAQAIVLAALIYLDMINVWLLFGLTAILGVANAFTLGVQLALVPSLIPREVLTAAVAFNSVIFNSARFVGPAIGGLILTEFGAAETILANVFCFVVFLFLLFRVKPITDEVRSHEQRGLIGDMVDGYRYASAHGGIAAVLVLLLAISLGGRAINELLPQISAVMLDQGEAAFATLMASVGVGAVVVGLWLSSRGNRPGLTKVAILLTLLLGLAVLVIPFVGNLALAIPVMTVIGFSSSGCGIASQTLLQLAVDGQMRGRVLSLFGMIFRGGPALGALIIGYAFDFFGVRLPVFVAGMLVVGVFVWLWLGRARIAASLEAREHGGAAGAPAALAGPSGQGQA